MISACNSALCYKEITLHTPAFSRFQDFYMDIISRFKILIAVISHVFGLIAQFAAQPLTVRCPSDVRSCKHGVRPPGLSRKKGRTPQSWNSSRIFILSALSLSSGRSPRRCRTPHTSLHPAPRFSLSGLHEALPADISSHRAYSIRTFLYPLRAFRLLRQPPLSFLPSAW